MKIIKVALFLLLLLALTNQVSATEFVYTVKITSYANSWNSMYNGSGTIIGEDDKTYKILSCAHIFEDLGNNAVITVVLFSKEDMKQSITVPAKIIKKNNNTDLSYLEIEKSSKICPIEIKPIKLSDSTLIKGAKCNAYGFPGLSTFLNNRVMVADNYDAYAGDTNLLVCKGIVDQGMSGGPLVANGKVHGVLVHKNEKDKTGSFITVIDCRKFLEE